MRNLIGIGIVAVVLIVGFIFRDFLSGNAAELDVGQCFDPPTTNVETVEDVQHHPCDQAHGGEVFFVGESTAGDDEPYPSDQELTTEVFGFCDPSFTSYTGMDSNTDPTWTYGYFIPTSDGWDDGDRGIICYATRIDGATTTGSIKQ
ncbi:MAG: septum formation family protein [Chloroflexi bacterium]|nr:septum formation family protein [Chloroflexota bacterium]